MQDLHNQTHSLFEAFWPEHLFSGIPREGFLEQDRPPCFFLPPRSNHVLL